MAMILMSLGHPHLSVGPPGSFLTMSSSLGVARMVVHYHSGHPHHYSVQHRPDGGEWVHYDVVGDGACGRRALDLIKVLLSGEHVYFGRDLSDHGWEEKLVKEPELVLNEAFDVGGDATYVWAVKHDDFDFARRLQEAGGGGLPLPVQEAAGPTAHEDHVLAVLHQEEEDECPSGAVGVSVTAPAGGGRAPAAHADVEHLADQAVKAADEAKAAQVAADGHFAIWLDVGGGTAQAASRAHQQWVEAVAAADEAIAKAVKAARAADAAQVANDAAIAAALAN